MKPKGLLTVVGSIDIRQFWPATKGVRSSDGDTVHMKVNPTTFMFATSPGAKHKQVTKFVGAYVNDHGRKKNVITAKSEIKIRLQGIDTPELHYPVIATWDPSKRGKYANEFRQPHGAGAANALHDHLKGFTTAAANPNVFATFVTRIDNPSEAIDSHGRFVGDILVGTSGGKSINTWLVETGWAHPLLYDSMTDAEVQTIVDAWKMGRSIAGRAGKAFAKALQQFVPGRAARNAKLPDAGSVNFPKIFRRQATFWTEIAGPLSGDEFAKRLTKGTKGKPDTAYPRGYFLANIDKLNPKKRIKLASKIGTHGETLFKPEDLVFREDPSTLLAASGAKIKNW